MPVVHRNVMKQWGIRRGENGPVEYVDGSPVILYLGAEEPLTELAPDWDSRCLYDGHMLEEYVVRLLRRAGELK